MSDDRDYESQIRRGAVMGIDHGKIVYHPQPSHLPLAGWISKHFPEGYQGYAVDVGASDGVSVNSTLFLESNLKWTVIAVEPNPHFKPMLIRNRIFVETCALGAERSEAMPLHVNLGNFEAYSSLNPQKNNPRAIREGATEWEEVLVRVRTLEDLLAQYEFPQLDALCIDTEGTESDVLKGLDLEKWKPRVVVVEAWTEGACDSSLPGYKRVTRQGDNDCYVREPECESS